MSSSAPSHATDLAFSLLAEFVQRGVLDVVLCPGSRSQALALAAAEFERVDAIRLHVRTDERIAGFLALGLSLETMQPTIVIVTSGTAVANLHPSVLEAHHAGVPMIILSADRPAELRGTRSNQTTDQAGLFGNAARLSLDISPTNGNERETAARLSREAIAAARGRVDDGARVPFPGPVQINLQFQDPLSEQLTLVADSLQRARNTPLANTESTGAIDGGTFVNPGPLTVVVAGAEAGIDAEVFAVAGGWPLIAEVSSGARFGPNLVLNYREVLKTPGFGDRIQRVVVFGHPTLSREVPEAIERDGVETIVVAAAGVEWYNPGHRARRFERAVRVGPALEGAAPEERARDVDWLRAWVAQGREFWADAQGFKSAASVGIDPASVETAAIPTQPGARSDADRALGSRAAGAGAAFVGSGVAEHGHVTDVARQRRYLAAEQDALHAPVTRASLAEAVWAATWPHDRLFFGASRLIREADQVVPGRNITARANRGLSGIDGTVSTGIGMAIAAQVPPPRIGAEREASASSPRPSELGVMRILIGDLATLHDVGALRFGAGERRPRIQLVVGNDGGGSLFELLEVADSATRAAFDRVVFTPQSVSFAALAAGFDWDHREVVTASQLTDALGSYSDRPVLIEVRLPRRV